MKITVFSGKGGVGKSATSSLLVSLYDLMYYTNDFNNFLNIYPNHLYKEDLVNKDIKSSGVIDLGGYITKDTKEILLNSDMVILPIINDDNSILKTKQHLKNLDIILNKIILVATNTSKGDFDFISKKFKDFDLKVVEIKHSKLFKNAKKNKVTLSEELEKGGFKYRVIEKDIQNLINLIENKGK